MTDCYPLNAILNQAMFVILMACLTYRASLFAVGAICLVPTVPRDSSESQPSSRLRR
jgi:hypothetical protein